MSGRDIEAVEAVAEHLWNADRHVLDRPTWALAQVDPSITALDKYRADAWEVIRVAQPFIAAAERERIAQAIEAEAADPDWNSADVVVLLDAAVIARTPPK